MPVPTSIADLSTTAIANSPQGTDTAKGTIDEYFRAHAKFIAENRDAVASTAKNNSGLTAPTTIYANQWWADTTSGILKRRNAGNTAWISVMSLTLAISTFSETVLAAANAAAARITLGAAARGANADITSLTGLTTALSIAQGGTGGATAAAAGAALGAIGAGQTWASVAASRALGATYTNSTGRPIAVNIILTGSTAGVATGSAQVGTFYVAQQTLSESAYANWDAMVGTLAFIVPSGSTYVITGSGNPITIAAWMELR